MQTSPLVPVALVAAALFAATARAQSGPPVVAPDPVAVASPVLSLGDALREADQRAFGNRIAAATTAGAHARARLPLKGILPSARIEAGVVRTTDPIGAFGTTLRQRLVTPTAFEPARLNNPNAVSNVQGSLVLEVPLLNSDAWLGLRAARAVVDASTAAGEWSAVSTRANVVRAYYGAILAESKADVLARAQQSADAGLRQVRAMVAQGLVTKADALQASVRASDVAAQLLGARTDALAARQQLGLLLGRTSVALPTLPSSLPDADALITLATRDSAAAMVTVVGTPPVSDVRENARSDSDGDSRNDVRAAQAGVMAASADRRRAAGTLLPRVNGFARYDWNDPRTLYAGQKNWTVGVMASWSVFGGNAELADMAETSARADAARAGLDAARAKSRLERDDAARRLTLSLQRLTLARDAADQSREAHRLVQKRYEAGLATIADLLAAESSATGAALAQAAARYAVIDAIATWRLASGGDPAALTALDESTTRTR